MTATNNSLDQVISQCQSILAQCVVAANEAAIAAAFLAMESPAPLNSPAFTGVPTAPTAPANTNTNQIATTAYLDRLMGTANGIPTLDNTGHIPTAQLPSAVLGGLSYEGTWNASTNTPTLASGVGTDGNFYVVSVAGTTTLDGISTWNVGDQAIFGPTTWKRLAIVYTPVTGITLSSLAVQAADTFVANATGSSAAPTAITATQATALLNAMVGDSGSGGTKGLVPAPPAGSFAAGKYLDASGNYSVPPGQVSPGDLSAYALLAGPAFTGTPTAPTQAVDLASTALATCQFVINQAASATPIMDGTAAVGTSTRFARGDHVHPTDTSRAALTSPTFTGVPAAPTASPGTNTTQIATTAYADAIAVLKANLASPTFTGVPAAPTASPGTNTTQLATAAFVAAAAALLAPLASPALTGTPTAPTAGGGTNTTQVATTAFVQAAVAGVAGQPIPSSSAFGVGTLAFLFCNTTVANGSTISGVNLTISGFSLSGCPPVVTMNQIGGSTQSGTWKNVSGASVSNSTGYFVRTA